VRLCEKAKMTNGGFVSGWTLPYVAVDRSVADRQLAVDVAPFASDVGGQ